MKSDNSSSSRKNPGSDQSSKLKTIHNHKTISNLEISSNLKLPNRTQSILKSISIILLAYNEEKNIGRLIDASILFAKKREMDYEIIVVCYEGSTDKTLEIVKEKQKLNNKVRQVIQKKGEKGYGVALTMGIVASKNHLIFYTDGDNQFDINELERFLPLIKRYDLVVGYRKKRNDPFMRLIYAFGYNFITNILYGIKMKDVDCAFKLFRKEIFGKVHLKSRTGVIDAEIMAKAKKFNYSYIQLPVSHYPRTEGAGTFQVSGGFIKWKVITGLIKELRIIKKELDGIE